VKRVAEEIEQRPLKQRIFFRHDEKE
jgi:hypothetical protein